jgi:hypothetical protein
MSDNKNVPASARWDSGAEAPAGHTNFGQRLTYWISKDVDSDARKTEKGKEYSDFVKSALKQWKVNTDGTVDVGCDPNVDGDKIGKANGSKDRNTAIKKLMEDIPGRWMPTL